jgi:hypothetical protein
MEAETLLKVKKKKTVHQGDMNGSDPAHRVS